MLYNARTDLASEAHALLNPAVGENHGVIAHTDSLHGLKLVSVEITNVGGERTIGKPRGKYFTLTLPPRFERGAADFPSAACAVRELILRCVPHGFGSCLVAALGNPDITPDALGSLAASHILVTRHLKLAAEPGFEPFGNVALCRTGVLGTTGVESAAQLAALIREVKPDFVIAVDALAGSEADSLGRCVQVCSAGIAPGSGVKNDRTPLTRDTLGVPVVAVGVPTVIDASALGGGAALAAMFVTPREIDSLVRSAARVIAYGINMALHPGLSAEDIDMLVG